MMKTFRLTASALTAMGIALTLSMAGPAQAEVRLDPERDYSVRKYLKTGDTPYIDFTTIEGEVVTNESLKGKVVIFDVWATWCGPCMEAMPHFKNLADTYGDSDKIEFFGISMDKDRETLDQGIKDNDITWKQVFDQERVLNKAWNQGMLPRIAILAPTGESLYVGHPMGMDGPFHEALKKYVPEKYDASVHEAALVKAAEAKRVFDEAMAKRRAEFEAKAAAQAAAAYKPGSFPLSELGLVDIEDNAVSAESLKGKVLIMGFWASGHGPSMESVTKLKELYAKHHDTDGLEIIGMSRDRDLDTLIKTRDEVGMPWIHVIDKDATYTKKFNATSLPTAFIFSRSGELLWSGSPVGMDEVLAKVLADDALTAKDFVKEESAEAG